MKTLRASRIFSFLFLALFALTALPSQASQYSRLVIFGDSLSDPGNAFVLTGMVAKKPYALIPDYPYAQGGLHFSNGNNWAEVLGAQLGLGSSVGPAFRTSTFSNYAIGGARARVQAGGIHLSDQVSRFLDDNGQVAPADALYVIFIGGNDISQAIRSLVNPNYNGPPLQVVLTGAVQSIKENIETLLDRGARNVLVVNGPNLGLVPATTINGPAAQSLGTSISVNYNSLLQGPSGMLQQLQANHPELVLMQFDLFSFMNAAVANPSAFGLTEATTPCITPGVIVGAVCKNPKNYLFWDGIHPTVAGHRAMAAAIRNVVTP